MKTLVKVISLEKAAGRRKTIAERLDQAGFEWSFFNAHAQVTASLSYSDRDAWIAKDRPMTDQELGCYSSHYSLWKEFLETDADQMLVFEDDAGGDLGYVKNRLIPVDFSAKGMHLLRLYMGYPCASRFYDFIAERRVFRLSGYVEGALAYLITRKGAETLVRHCAKVCRPVDDEMDRSWIHGVRSFAFFPAPCMEIQVPTQIPGREKGIKKKNPYPLQRFLYRLKDKFFRLAG